jgi:hypothetical protein
MPPRQTIVVRDQTSYNAPSSRTLCLFDVLRSTTSHRGLMERNGAVPE